jgi:L1 cell adhesion molecule like protein
VFDFGGGTHDVSVLNVQGKKYTVLATEGDTLLGGRDVDKLVLDILEDFLKKAKFDFQIRDDDTAEKRALKQSWARRLRAHATVLKEELSIKAEVDMECGGIFGDDCPPSRMLKREELERAMETSGMLKKLLAPVHKAMGDMKVEDFKTVMLTGGSSRIPIVRRTMREMFGTRVSQVGNFDFAVAHGAALLASSLQDIAEGVDCKTGDNLVLMDILPLSLGIKMKDDIFSPILSKGMKFPCDNTQSYQTTTDNQTSVLINIFQGEEQQASKNQSIAEYFFNNLPLRPAGEAAVGVKFTMDPGGVLGVDVFDKSNVNHKLNFQVNVERVGELANQDEGMDLIQDKNLATAFDSLTMAVYNAEYMASQFADLTQRARAQKMLRDHGFMTFIHETPLSGITMDEIDRRLAHLNQYMDALNAPTSPEGPLKTSERSQPASPVLKIPFEVTLQR